MPEQNWKTPGYDPSRNGWWKASLGEEVSNFGYPHTYLFADSMRAIIQAFLKHFSNIWVCKYDEDGYPRKNIQVPIKFGPRSKAYDYRKELDMKQKTGRTYYIPQPNMTFKITGTQYDESRVVSVDTIRTFYDTALIKRGVEYKQLDLLWQDTVPVPYIVNIEMNANCENMADAMQIWEQVCCQFSPDINLRVKEFWFIDIPRDIKVVLESTNFDFNEDYGEEEKREINVKFQFKLECVVYTGIQHGDIIDQIRVILDPSIAKTASENDIYQVFSGDKFGNIYLNNEPGNAYNVWGGISATILEPYGDCYRIKPEMYTSGNITSSFEPIYYTEQAKQMESADDWFIEYRFTSGYYDNKDEKYLSYMGVSGNYRPEPGTYNSATYDWQGSLTDRYKLNKLQPWQHSASKDFFDGREVVRTTIATEHTNNEGYKF